MINWNLSTSDRELVKRIAQRAVRDLDCEFIDISMSITAVHLNDVRLDLNKLLDFDDFNFAHDINGIDANINKNTGKLANSFLPRCTEH